MRLHARHGWGYDAGFWAPLAALLGPLATDDRGYFGPRRDDPVDEAAPHVLIGHSLGVMRSLSTVGPGCRGIVSINGFDRFAGGSGFPGVPPRLLDRMAARCASDPAGTVTAFRARCGDGEPPPAGPTTRLAADLALLRAGDVARPFAGPMLRLDGGADPLLSPDHRAACFAGAPAQVLAGGGHLLPLSHPAWCASAIAGFVGTLA